MHIRSPKTAFVTLRKLDVTNVVSPDEVLFSFDVDEEKLELLKVETSILLLEQLKEQLTLAGGETGTARLIQRTRMLGAAKSKDAFGQLLKHREDQWSRAGEISRETFEQAKVLECLSRKEYREAELECANLISTTDELIEITDMQLSYNRRLKHNIEAAILRSTIRSPVGGSITIIQSRSGWVATGDILATIG